MTTISLSNSSNKISQQNSKLENFAFAGEKFERYREALKLETVHVHSN